MKTKLFKILLTVLLAFGFVGSVSANEYGSDFSNYQGAYGKYNSSRDIKFAFSKLGGDGFSYVSPVYNSQVNYGISHGVRMHTYLWAESVLSISQADYFTGKYLPMVKTPKGSIVAIDVESGYVNNDAIIRMMLNIRNAGYTPMIYTGRPFIISRGIDINRIVNVFGNKSVWIASYPVMSIDPEPLFAYFPSVKGVGIWQYSSNGSYGGLDMDIDLTGVTKVGYNGHYVAPVTPSAPAKTQPVKPNTQTYTVKYGDTLSGIAQRFGTTTGNLTRVNGLKNPNFIYPGQVIHVSAQFKPQPAAQTYVVKYGDTLSGIAQRLGTTTGNLTSVNGLRNPNFIYPGQVIRVSGQAVVQSTQRSYVVKYGDTLSGIAQRFGTTTAHLTSANGLRNPNFIYPGQVIHI